MSIHFHSVTWAVTWQFLISLGLLGVPYIRILNNRLWKVAVTSQKPRLTKNMTIAHGCSEAATYNMGGGLLNSV